MSPSQQSLGELVSHLESGDASQRAAAAEALCQSEQSCQAACIPLVKACGSDEATREWAASALESMGDPPLDSVTELAEMLHDSSPDVAYWSATLLGRLQANAASACDALAEVVASGQDLSVRQRAIWAVKRIGCASPTLVKALETAKESQNPRLARLAQQTLDEISSA